MENEENKNSSNESQNVKKRSTFGEFIKEVRDIALLVIFVLIPIRIFIAQPFIVVGSSMYPTFENGDYLIVDEITYRFKNPERGDVIVFRPPQANKEHYIKRIIGLPGETVSVNGNTVIIKNSENPEGFELKEEYVSSLRNGVAALTLGEEEYFVMGDNREASSDSRVWGALSVEKITGRALVRLFPVQKADLFPGKMIFKE